MINGVPPGARGTETVAVEGEGGIEEFYFHPNGMVEIRMSDPEDEEYRVPAGQVLAFISEEE